MNIEKYLTCILLNSDKIKKICSTKKELDNIELINKLCFEVFEKSIQTNHHLQIKVKEMSDFVGLNLSTQENLENFFLHYENIQFVDRFKNMLIIYNINEFLSIVKQFQSLDSTFIKKLKMIDYFLSKIPENQEDQFKLKIMLVERSTLEIEYVLELLKLKKKIYDQSFMKNKEKVSDIKMKINSRKIKFINELENLEEENDVQEIEL
ncbi:MAG: hypothetical protein GY828_02305 [Candidatus Gracilibacteria bacterium]|nr:hypothetical protein [Candidatus Gracilibacteria bacterium]